jgi:hypothetical protein
MGSSTYPSRGIHAVCHMALQPLADVVVVAVKTWFGRSKHRQEAGRLLSPAAAWTRVTAVFASQPADFDAVVIAQSDRGQRATGRPRRGTGDPGKEGRAGRFALGRARQTPGLVLILIRTSCSGPSAPPPGAARRPAEEEKPPKPYALEHAATAAGAVLAAAVDLCSKCSCWLPVRLHPYVVCTAPGAGASDAESHVGRASGGRVGAKRSFADDRWRCLRHTNDT